MGQKLKRENMKAYPTIFFGVKKMLISYRFFQSDIFVVNLIQEEDNPFEVSIKSID